MLIRTIGVCINMCSLWCRSSSLRSDASLDEWYAGWNALLVLRVLITPEAQHVALLVAKKKGEHSMDIRVR